MLHPPDMSAKVRTESLGSAALLESLPVGVLAELFEHVPDTAFFVKDTLGRYVAVNTSMAERVGASSTRHLHGRTVRDFYPTDLAERFARQDDAVLRSGRPILDTLELHWYPRRKTGWCFTTKLPLRDGAGRIVGVVGVSRDLHAPAGTGQIPPGLIKALDYLETQYSEPMSPASLARMAGLPPVRFARMIKRLFRITPSRLISQTRLAAASRMLEDTDKQVAEIAHASGFYDHSAFTRAFRSATGATPSEYRRSRRAERGG